MANTQPRIVSRYCSSLHQKSLVVIKKYVPLSRHFCGLINSFQLNLFLCNCNILPFCVYQCVYVHPPWRLYLSGSFDDREQINNVILKTFDSYAKSLHRYFSLNQTFQTSTLSCSHTRSRQSHDLTSVRLAFKT